jgi:aldose 1-epimerase
MRYQVTTESRPAADRDGTVYVLQGDGERAEVWPALGFNCYRWQTARGEHLYADPQLFAGGSPTRSGVPVLFPFPNRVRDGRFTWNGKAYQLPPNDPSGKNAIHGFACRKPWRVVDHGADDGRAWLTAEFHGARDAPESLALWPADYRLRVTYQLSGGRLRIDALVDNPDRVPLPFGLGYHPYFQVGGEDWTVQAGARSYWELQDSLPTGALRPVDAPRDLTAPRRFGDLQLDDVLTGVRSLDGEQDGLRLVGVVADPAEVTLRLWAAPAFRELVAFTPPHRRAVCLEPYTCVTDAVNLQPRGVDAGLLVLPPGGRWSAAVEVLLSNP